MDLLLQRSTHIVPRRILIVDDYIDMAESLAVLLRLEGHEVTTAWDGANALACAARFQPEVVLLDIGLPQMDGYEVAQRLRAMERLRGIVLIAITGYGRARDRLRTKAAGFDQHLINPLDLKVLRGLLTPSQSGF